MKAFGTINTTESISLAGSMRYLGPSGSLAEIYPRYAVSNFAGLAAVTTGRIGLWALELEKGTTYSTITFRSSATAFTGPSWQWAALFDSSSQRVRVTNDDLTNAWSANTNKTFTFATPFGVTQTGLYYAGLCLVGGSVPTLLGINNTTNLTGQIPITAGSADTGLTGVASCPVTAAALTAIQPVPYIYLS